MQLHNHTDTQTVKHFPALKGLCDVYIVRKNEIAASKLSGSAAQLRSCAPLREHVT